MLILLIGIAQVLQVVLLCRPFAKIWNWLLPGECGSARDVFFASASMNLIVDVVLVILPLPMVWQLQMARRRKIAISIMFGLGIM